MDDGDLTAAELFTIPNGPAMKLLDSNTLETWMSSEDSGDINSNLMSFTHIADDEKTLRALLKYTSMEANNCGLLSFDDLEEISAPVLMIFLRSGGGVDLCQIYFPSLKTLDVACARMLVKAVREGTSALISLGFGFELSKLPPEVIAELYTAPYYGWTNDGSLGLYNVELFNEERDILL
jgi:hypothetical protein